jgi:hypothetical protein
VEDSLGQMLGSEARRFTTDSSKLTTCRGLSHRHAVTEIVRTPTAWASYVAPRTFDAQVGDRTSSRVRRR